MRINTLSRVAILLLLPGIAAAQQTAPAPATPSPVASAPVDLGMARQQGHVDVGLRMTSITGDEARFSRFRDLRDGPYLAGLRMERESRGWFFQGEANNVGYRDQRFFGSAEQIGRVKLAFEWDQVPLFISRDTRTLQRNLGNGVLDVDDSIQSAIENRTLTLADAMARATPFDMRSSRDTARFTLTYAASRELDLKLRVTNTNKSGYHLQSFGLLTSPGGFTQELGVPIDNRTTDVTVGAEWANRRGMVSAGVNASWFDNGIPTVQFDNPQRITDISAGASKGVTVMPPSNTLVTFTAAGAYKLPARTRATAHLSIGRANQNEPLVAATVNTALVAPPLMRTTADASADIISMNYGLTSRPTEHLSLNARYRFYDYANKTRHFASGQLVGDWALGSAIWENEPLSVTRRTVDLDASFSPWKHASFGAGYTRENAKRSFRIFENTAEDVFRVTADSTGNQYFTVRLKFEKSNREGSHFDEALLEEVGEQPEMRHFDIANRTRTRTTAILTLTPTAWLSVNGTVATGDDDYDETGFGLRDNTNRMYGAGFDMTPLDTVTFGVFYTHEKYTANQYSRTANPGVQFVDPKRDWWIDSSDRVKTISATLDLSRTLPRTDIRLGYDLSDGSAAYVYGQPGNQTVFTTVPLAQLPTLTNRLRDARADVQYFLRPTVAIGFGYRFEDYAVRDFALDAGTLNTLVVGTSTIYTGYMYRPYTAHTGWLRVTYLW